MNLNFTFAIIASLICVGCSSGSNESTNPQIQNIHYLLEDSNNSEGGDFYDICNFSSPSATVVIMELVGSRSEYMRSDPCNGGNYSRGIVIQKVKIWTTLAGNPTNQTVDLRYFRGLLANGLKPGDTVLAQLHKNQDEWFVDSVLQVDINTLEPDNSSYNETIDLPRDYQELVNQLEYARMNPEDRCPRLALLSDEEFDNFFRGDLSSCVDIPEENDDNDDICKAEPIPECCLNDLLDCPER